MKSFRDKLEDMNKDFDEVFRCIFKKEEQSTSIMENLEEKHSQTTRKFQTFEENY